jgi:hypothetical protein
MWAVISVAPLFKCDVTGLSTGHKGCITLTLLVAMCWTAVHQAMLQFSHDLENDQPKLVHLQGGLIA